MAERLAEMPRLLKPTGSIYMHCDPTASHGLKMVMDTIFGPRNFLNEIVWKRTSTKNDYKQGAVNWPRVHDCILHYQRSRKRQPFNQPFGPLSAGGLKPYRYTEEGTGRKYQLTDLTAPGRGTRGHPEYELMGVTRYWRYSEAKMLALAAEGRVVQTAPGRVPRYKRYLDESRGVAIGDVWIDIPPLQGAAREYLGYQTQKPVRLLDRIVEASSNPGDMVLDPFCGCGTTVAAAHKLNRRWAGIDISPFAIDLIASKRFPEFKVPTEGYPYDLAGAAKLAREQPFKFEKWAVTRIPGLAPNDQQVGDGGIDGVGYLLAKPDNGATDQVLAQVKGGRYHIGQLRDFMGVMERERAAMGLFATVQPIRASGAHAEAAKRGSLLLGASEYPRAQLWSMADYFDGRMPLLPALADPYTGKPVQQSVQLEMT
jgi:SAM-dependent methyltransferase